MSVTIYLRYPSHCGAPGAVFEVMNQANTNFKRICTLLGFDCTPTGEISGEALLDLQQSIDFVLETLHAVPALDNGVAQSQSEIDLGAQRYIHIDCGVRAGYFREKLTILKSAVDRAVAVRGSLYWY